MSPRFRDSGIISGIALATLLIGAATGSAYVMFGMAVAVLIVLAAVYRRKMSGGAILMSLVAALVATATGMALTMR